MGISWRNISDGYFKTGSVGAIAVAESDPNVVYVGMGEHAVRGVMTHHGDGVYKSTDAGKTWKKIGLDATQHISRIVVDPKNPNIVFVAAQGALYSKSSERGIFKSVDGGATWKKVLYVDDKTGAAELSMDMNEPFAFRSSDASRVSATVNLDTHSVYSAKQFWSPSARQSCTPPGDFPGAGPVVSRKGLEGSNRRPRSSQAAAQLGTLGTGRHVPCSLTLSRHWAHPRSRGLRALATGLTSRAGQFCTPRPGRLCSSPLHSAGSIQPSGSTCHE